MYESPIAIITDEIISEIRSDYEKTIYSAVQNVGIQVDKNELVKALNYDRKQYEKGYKDGYESDKFVSVDQCLPETRINRLTNDYENIICLCKFVDFYDIRIYRFGDGHFWSYGKNVDNYVVAWQYLPEIPKEYM